MKFFSKNETLVVGAILVLIVGVTLSNLKIANRRSRDTQRRSDVRSIASALEKYNSEFGFVPPDVDGEILACKGEKFDEFMVTKDTSQIESFFDLLIGCQWGEDGLVDLTGDSQPYLKSIPSDPSPEVSQYLYLSNSKRFQIFSYLEGGEKAEQYDKSVQDRKLNCGTKICNFGIGFSDTPVDITISEYELRLQEIDNEKN
ncbi:type II secretion system protein [Patescibacteria group bacterium]